MFLAEGKGSLEVEIRGGSGEWFFSPETDEDKRRHFMAFRDFCLDLFEEEYGRIPPEGEIDPRFVKGLPIRV